MYIETETRERKNGAEREIERKKERESSDDVVMYLGGRETMAVFRNYSSLYASPLTPLDSVFRLILTDLFVLCFVHTTHVRTLDYPPNPIN